MKTLLIRMSLALLIPLLGCSKTEHDDFVQAMDEKTARNAEKLQERASEVLATGHSSVVRVFEPEEAQKLRRSEIVRAQRRLYELGYLEDPADGYLGPHTEAAVKQFQANLGLPPTGALTRTTLERLYDYEHLAE